MKEPLTSRPGPKTKHRRPRAKPRYHHGSLQQAALQRGRELVARFGPDALTLRGLARELGVSATALVYHFGSLAGLRSSVAAAVIGTVPATTAPSVGAVIEIVGRWVSTATHGCRGSPMALALEPSA